MAAPLVSPAGDEVLAFCAEEPVERVFLEEIARRGTGRFSAVRESGRLAALCHRGTNVVPSGRGCQAFAALPIDGDVQMIIGEERAVGELWEAAKARLPIPRADRPGQPVYAIVEPPPPGGSALRPAAVSDLPLLLPACADAHAEELGTNPLDRDPAAFRDRTESQIDEGRSWLWTERGTILFKAEASAWTPHAVQLQQVWVDPAVRRRGYAKRGLADLCRLLLEEVPTVCLFVRRDNAPAIALYESVGMRRVLTYRTVLF